jgi:threonine/homoserine/homoserine lactone efflux protein
MPELSQILFFMSFALGMLLTPGPAVFYIVTRSVDQGRMAGIVSVLGIATGTLFHIAAAAFGLSALLMTSALAFDAVKYLGAAYLVYLGVRKLFFEKPPADSPDEIPPQPLRQIFAQGIVVNLTNPKTALFFFSFLPQFVDPARGSVALQILFLGTLFTVMAITSDSMYALLSGSLAGWLKRNRNVLNNLRYFSGGMYILLGITAAVAGSRQK